MCCMGVVAMAVGKQEAAVNVAYRTDSRTAAVGKLTRVVIASRTVRRKTSNAFRHCRHCVCEKRRWRG